jgi:hypothetical protein
MRDQPVPIVTRGRVPRLVTEPVCREANGNGQPSIARFWCSAPLRRPAFQLTAEFAQAHIHHSRDQRTIFEQAGHVLVFERGDIKAWSVSLGYAQSARGVGRRGVLTVFCDPEMGLPARMGSPYRGLHWTTEVLPKPP